MLTIEEELILAAVTKMRPFEDVFVRGGNSD